MARYEVVKKEKIFQINESEYQYFDMGKIAGNLRFSSVMHEEAKKLIQSKKLTLDKIEFGYFRFLTGVEQGGRAVARYETGRYPAYIMMIFNKNEIIQARCDIPSCSGYYYNDYYRGAEHICVHMLALMILTDEYLKKYKPGDITDTEGSKLLSGFRNFHVKEVIGNNTEEVQDLVLEPVLEKRGNALSVSFKAGVERLYVVKNLPEFVEKYESRDDIKFGTKTEIDLAEHRMNDASKNAYEYIKSVVKQEEMRNEHMRESSYYFEGEQIKNQISLYGERLDRFYDLFEGREILCNDKSTRSTVKTTLKLQGGKPDIRLTITQNMDAEGVFHGINAKGKIPASISGNQHLYFLTKNTLCRMDDQITDEIRPLYELEDQGEIKFSVGRKNLSEFYHQILPVLKRNIAVKELESDVIQQYIPPAPVFRFYLDAENGNVFCKPKALYGENIVSLVDHYRRDFVFESFRGQNQEEEVLYHLHKFFSEIDVEKDELHCGGSEDAVLRLLDVGVDKLMSLGEVHTTDRFKRINFRKKPKINVGVSVESDIMNLSISSEDIDQEELLSILQSYRRKKKYYRLKNGDFVSMNEQDMEMLNQMIETMNISSKEFLKGNMKIPMYRALYLNKMLEQGENIYLERDKHYKALIKEFKTVEDSDFELPVSLKSVVRNYQEHGFKWMKTLESYGFGGILADDMGLGKTLQMISVLLEAKEKGNLDTALIVSPASLVYNWKAEFSKFAPQLNVVTVTGIQSERAEIIKNYQKFDVLITSYDLLRRDIAEYEDCRFTYQVIDEAQYIKNHTTAAAKSVKIIQSRHKFALTGTPIENRLSELWSIFDYLMPGFLYGYDTFRKQMETPIVKHKEERASEQLKKMVAPFVLRRLKGDVLKDLPEKIEEVRYAKLEENQQQLYDAQVVHMKALLAAQDEGDYEKSKLQILAELTKIRQICCDPGLLFEQYRGDSAKRQACMELIQSAIAGEHKILLFSQFTSMLELLEQDLNQQKIAYYKITGATPKENRLEMVDAFNTDQTPVFLVSLKAGGTGLNLTGADVVIHYDPWWNQAVQNQATDRAHRIGQTKVVTVYQLIAQNTIEEKIVKMQESKRDLADSILNGNMGGIAQMSKEELMELLAVAD